MASMNWLTDDLGVTVVLIIMALFCSFLGWLRFRRE